MLIEFIFNSIKTLLVWWLLQFEGGIAGWTFDSAVTLTTWLGWSAWFFPSGMLVAGLGLILSIEGTKLTWAINRFIIRLIPFINA